MSLKASYVPREAGDGVFLCRCDAVQVAWVGLQLTVLYAQRRFGPRFFIPARFLPEKYNYFRPVRVTAPGRVEDDPTGRAHRTRASPAVAT